MWEQGVDVSKPDLLATVLSKRFSPSEVKSILEGANSAEYKQLLNDKTKEALDHGAFGCPWFWVTNSKGEEEPFFGSDRYVRCFFSFPPLCLKHSTTFDVTCRLAMAVVSVSLRCDVWGKGPRNSIGPLPSRVVFFLGGDLSLQSQTPAMRTLIKGHLILGSRGGASSLHLLICVQVSFHVGISGAAVEGCRVDCSWAWACTGKGQNLSREAGNCMLQESGTVGRSVGEM